MESFIVYLNPLQKRYKYSPYYLSILGVLYIFLGIMFFQKESEIYSSGWLWIIGGIGALVGSYFQTNYSSKYFFEINNNSIIVKQSLGKANNYSWGNN